MMEIEQMQKGVGHRRSLVRNKYGPIFGISGGIFAFATSIGYETGNILGTILALQAIFGFGSIPVWGTIVVALAILLLVLPELYDRLESLILILIAVMLIGFAGTLAIVGFSPAKTTTGLTPSFPSLESLFLAVAMMSIYFSLYGGLYQNYLVREKDY
ncbi:divalent metal cation transporter [Halostagnicola sp. A56]|uniref:divalent metal cation transporter n=1 Tax=Halostagnicola sp. A56 TaxID=1495067 RepID=UPI0009E266F5|nr:divalent metal cation transporter [Halostagnicola sp. A56]